MTREVVTYPDDAVLTVLEVAAYLRINKDHAYELINSGSIPSVKLGRQFRVPAWGLKTWIANQAGAPYSGVAKAPASNGLRH